MIPLSPIDLVFTGRGAYPLEFVFAYEGRIDPGRLEESLRRTLALFPAAGSRLVPHEGAYALLPSPAGWTFAVGAGAESFADTKQRQAFADPVETVEGAPLLRVRLTGTPGGSVLGVSVSHAIVDGFSYFYLLSAWSRVFNGRAVPPPHLDRALLAPPRDAGPTAVPVLDAEAVREGCGLFLDARRPAIPRDRLRWTRRVFAREELRALLAEAQSGCPVRLSHNDVLAAWLWREHVPSWADPAEPAAFASCPVDVRRVAEGFPPTYFGCAVTLASATVERERLRDVPLADLARRVRQAVDGVDEARLGRSLLTIDALTRGEGPAALERLHVVHPRAGLLVTNLSRLPVREIVFDAGPPVAHDILAPAERCAVVLPAEDGLDVRVCLPAS